MHVIPSRKWNSSLIRLEGLKRQIQNQIKWDESHLDELGIYSTTIGNTISGTKTKVMAFISSSMESPETIGYEVQRAGNNWQKVIKDKAVREYSYKHPSLSEIKSILDSIETRIKINFDPENGELCKLLVPEKEKEYITESELSFIPHKIRHKGVSFLDGMLFSPYWLVWNVSVFFKGKPEHNVKTYLSSDDNVSVAKVPLDISIELTISQTNRGDTEETYRNIPIKGTFNLVIVAVVQNQRTTDVIKKQTHNIAFNKTISETNKVIIKHTSAFDMVTIKYTWLDSAFESVYVTHTYIYPHLIHVIDELTKCVKRKISNPVYGPF